MADGQAVCIVARFRARAGQEAALRDALAALVPPTRLEPGCEQYDLVVNPDDPADLCILERWTDEATLGRHIAGEALRRAIGEARAFMDGVPEGRRYRVVI